MRGVASSLVTWYVEGGIVVGDGILYLAPPIPGGLHWSPGE